MRVTGYLLVVLILLTGCRDDPAAERLASRDPPPPAAILSPGVPIDLMQELRRLDAELEAALDEADLDRLLTAEAMTDQLMQARRPVDWLATGYDVEARLRQLQAMADRVVARLRRGASLGDVTDEVRTIRAAVQDLLAHLQRPGGGTAPPSLDSLLAQDPLRDVQSRSARAAQTAATAAQPAGQQPGQQPAQPTEPQPADPQPADPEPPPRPRPSAPLGSPVPPPDSLLHR